MFWMMHHGLHQYTDFYSYHLPTYFWMLSPLVGDDLSFVYWLRATTLVAVLGYLAMTRPVLWPFVFIFAMFGRMAEIRPDTFGLLLMNAGWFALLKRRAVLGALLAGLSLLFSARAAVVGVGFAVVCFNASNRSQIRSLILLASGTVLLAAAAFLAFHDQVMVILRAAFLEPGRVLPRMPLTERFGSIDRLIPVGITGIALLASLITYARNRSDYDAPIIAGACATQLLLILVDPAPHGYVYGWAMLPAVNGLLLLVPLLRMRPELLLNGIAGAGALLICSASLFFSVTGIRKPGPQSVLHLVPDARVSQPQLMSTSALVAANNYPGEIWNQLAVRRELCRRINGRVAAVFAYQPICLRDATFVWFGFAQYPQMLQHIADSGAAQLLIWGDWAPKPQHLSDRYLVGEGFALRTTQTSKTSFVRTDGVLP